MTEAATPRKARRDYRKSGFYKRTRRIKQRGLDGIDARTVEGRDALSFRDNAIADLGGKDITTTKKALLDVAVGERYLWRSGWAFIMADGGNVINKRRRAFYPAVRDIIMVGEALTRHLKDLGLQRVIKPLTLDDILDGDDDDQRAANGSGSTGEQAK